MSRDQIQKSPFNDEEYETRYGSKDEHETAKLLHSRKLSNTNSGPTKDISRIDNSAMNISQSRDISRIENSVDVSQDLSFLNR